jgi:uncharacterized metal-binding protein
MPAKEKPYSCNACSAAWQKTGKTYCSSGPEGQHVMPDGCPSARGEDVLRRAFDEYRGDSEDARMARVAAEVEGLCYQPIPGSEAVNPRWTRVEDTIAFAKRMSYRKIGVATCLGLLDETKRLSDILKAQGFQVESVCCKAGRTDKLELGLQESQKVRPGSFEPACNPIGQARLLNQASTQMNVIVGLCVGHDMLFAKHSQAPVTTLVVKDRVTGHNPVSVLYGQNFYYKRLQSRPVLPDETG